EGAGPSDLITRRRSRSETSGRCRGSAHKEFSRFKAPSRARTRAGVSLVVCARKRGSTRRAGSNLMFCLSAAGRGRSRRRSRRQSRCRSCRGRVVVAGVAAQGRKGMKAILYARVTTSDQRESSLEDQLRECEELYNRDGVTVIARETNHGMSGESGDRLATRVLQGIESGAADVVAPKIFISPLERKDDVRPV